jgi:hypothetical protein
VVAGGVNDKQLRSRAFELTTLDQFDSNEDVTLAFAMKMTRTTVNGEDKIKVKTKANYTSLALKVL